MQTPMHVPWRNILPALVLSASVQGPAQAAPDRPFTVSTIRYARAAVDGGAATKSMLMDLYLPRRCNPSCPVLVAVHGGSFLTGARDIDEQKEYGAAFAERGIALASISYRLEGDRPAPSPAFAGFARTIARATYEPTRGAFAKRGQALADSVAAAAEDATSAVAWLRENGAGLRLDPERIGLLGASAGAEVVLDVAYLSDDNGLRRPPVGVVVSIRGMIQDDRGTPGRQPFHAGDPPLFILHGTADTRLPFGEAVRAYRLAAAARVPVALHPVGAAGHELGGRGALRLRFDDGDSVADRLVRFIDDAFAHRLHSGHRECAAAKAQCPAAR